MRSGRRGAIILIVAVCLVGLLMFAGLCIDMGVMWTVLQRAQNAADAAALAGAADLPDADAARTQIAHTMEAINTAQTPPLQVNLETDITFYHSGDEIADYGQLEANAEAIEVACHAPTPYFFLRVAGKDCQNLVARAVARRTPSNGLLPFIFAHDSDSRNTGLRINGSGIEVEGDIHSNTGVRINGSHQRVDGVVEWRNEFRTNGSDNYFREEREGAVEGYPINYTYEQFLSYCTQTRSGITITGSHQTAPVGFIHVTGDLILNGSHLTAHDSVYVVDGSITFNGSNHNLTNCTFVAQGDITANGSSTYFATPNRDETLFFSIHGDIVANGSGEKTSGLIFAPEGEITYNGSSQCLRDGSLLAERITVNGSDFSAKGSSVSGAGQAAVALIR